MVGSVVDLICHFAESGNCGRIFYHEFIRLFFIYAFLYMGKNKKKVEFNYILYMENLLFSCQLFKICENYSGPPFSPNGVLCLLRSLERLVVDVFTADLPNMVVCFAKLQKLLGSMSQLFYKILQIRYMTLTICYSLQPLFFNLQLFFFCHIHNFANLNPSLISSC